MKSIDEYLSYLYAMEIIPDSDEGGYVVSYPELPGCLTIGEAIEDGVEIAKPYSLEDYSAQFMLRIPKSLLRSLAYNSKREGICMNQYCLYLLSKNDALESRKLK